MGEFFNKEAPHYLNEPFTKDTKEEIEFIMREFKLSEGQKSLKSGEKFLPTALSALGRVEKETSEGIEKASLISIR